MINKIGKFSLEKINQNLILVAILSLLFRVGNFSVFFIPKPFEIFVILICFLTIVDIVKNKKIKVLLNSIPENIKAALFCLVISILLGWGISIFNKIPITFNMILEFGTFVFSVTIFLLIIFYAKKYNKIYLYALLFPVIYVIFVIFPNCLFTHNFLEANTKFIGLTMNPNIFSKILLIPLIFFISKSVLEEENKWRKLFYIFLSSGLLALLLWTASRGAILSFIFGVISLGIILFYKNFNFKKIFNFILLIIIIITFGLILVPENGKVMIMSRIFSTFSQKQMIYSEVKDENSFKVIKDLRKYTTNDFSFQEEFENHNQPKNIFSEKRFEIWLFYLNKIFISPFGYGPNTHMESNILLDNGFYENTGPHNSYIQVWLWGGIFGLLSFIYILIFAIKNLLNSFKKNINIINISLFCTLISLIISIFFDDSFHFYWFWIILALSLIYKYEPEN